MKSYERFKYCGHLTSGKPCGEIAYNECNCGGIHRGDFDGWATKPKKKDVEKHPRFVCNRHLEKYAV